MRIPLLEIAKLKKDLGNENQKLKEDYTREMSKLKEENRDLRDEIVTLRKEMIQMGERKDQNAPA